jgi:hypothetical protein
MREKGPKEDHVDLESAQLKSKSDMHRRGGSAGGMSVVERVDLESENVNSRTVQLVKLLTEVGPDIPEISRRLGQFKESVRYRYKEKILNRGFAVQAAVDHERLGLKRMMIIGEVEELYRKYAQAMFAALSELSYVVGFARTLVGGEFVINLSVPAEHFEEVRSFFQSLKEKGLFSSFEALEFDWLRNTPMKSEYYDFDTGRWDFDWQEGRSEDYASAGYVPSSKVKFDSLDLQLIKELQMDANKTLKEIADKLGVNYKKLTWHYTAHVLQRKMLAGYVVNWMGTRYDYTLEKALHRKHRYFAVDLFVRNVSELELMTLRQGVSRLPFLWAEAGGRNYFAEFAIPVDNVVEGLQYLGNLTHAVKGRMSIYPIDQAEAARFTIAYKLYDQNSKKWQFSSKELAPKFDQLMMQIKAGVS